MILHKGVSFAQQISSLVLNLWCKDLVPQKRGKGNAVSVSSVSAAGLSLYAEQRVDFVQEIGDKELTHKRVRLSPSKLFLSLKSVMQRLGPTKKRKRKCSVCWVFRPLDCLYTLNREWTLNKRLVTKSWPTKGSDCHQQNSSLVSNLWCKELVPQKRGEGNAVSVSSVSATGLS